MARPVTRDRRENLAGSCTRHVSFPAKKWFPSHRHSSNKHPRCAYRHRHISIFYPSFCSLKPPVDSANWLCICFFSIIWPNFQSRVWRARARRVVYHPSSTKHPPRFRLIIPAFPDSFITHPHPLTSLYESMSQSQQVSQSQNDGDEETGGLHAAPLLVSKLQASSAL